MNKALRAGLLLSLALSVGCNRYMDPETAREMLDNPTAAVNEGSMGSIADDYFDAQESSWAGEDAFFVKDREGGGAGNLVNPLVNLPPVSKGVAGDIFCAVNLVTQIQGFDSCERGDTCEAELTINSCVLRLGDSGDEQASGKLHFAVSEQTTDEFDRGDLSIEFDGWAMSMDDTTVLATKGLLAFEYTDYHSGELSEVIFTADIEQKLIDTLEKGMFNNGVVWEHRARAATRASFESTETGESASLEILAFTDEDRENALVLVFDYDTHYLSDTHAVAEATMTVRGADGEYSCTWSAEAQELDESTMSYSSVGNCTDANGDSFSWDDSSS